MSAFALGLFGSHTLHAAVLSSFTLNMDVGSMPSYYPAQDRTTGWAELVLGSTPLAVAGFSVSSLPTTPDTVALLPGDPIFDTVNALLHQANAGFNNI